ncbi:hypothetical protein B0T17DRAFT_526367 [Bombardia bombarda]|uniref:Secreted protein n=1 Tax=Bombardia bombarda TaxID=252184 RepID=A0AA39X9D7_9PEZI|nr:hypothetical protein B0T17DRAFT_526367 [Bombardia bombarda]
MVRSSNFLFMLAGAVQSTVFHHLRAAVSDASQNTPNSRCKNNSKVEEETQPDRWIVGNYLLALGLKRRQKWALAKKSCATPDLLHHFLEPNKT